MIFPQIQTDVDHMHWLITGASGFIGRALTQRLLRENPLPAALGGIDPGRLGATSRMTLLDLAVDGAEDSRVRRLPGSIADPEIVKQAFEEPVDGVFHLASIPGGMTEQNYELARRVNLDATLLLLETARAQSIASQRPVTFVFASSIAVLGAPLPPRVDDATPLRPALTYGAHKLIGEILLEDFSRRGWVNGRAVRLPGIVARPPQRSGLMSAFLSDIIRDLAEGRPFACPIPRDATTWLMSLPCVVDNLLHAATMTAAACTGSRVWTLPALRPSMAQLVGAIAEVHGADVLTRVTYGSNPALEANFGRYPPLSTPAAEAAGFTHDGDLKTLVRRALLPAA
jgi:nucleoside-diphosphate-sugar epimerase